MATRMATSTQSRTQTVLVCCNYEGKKFNVNLRPGMKTKDVIAEASKLINVPAERLSALWCGQVIQADMSIQVLVIPVITGHLVCCLGCAWQPSSYRSSSRAIKISRQPKFQSG